MPHALKRTLIYAALIAWTFVALFPLYWTFTTTFKVAKDVQLGHIVPWVDFKPAWLGLRAIGLSPDTIFNPSTPREEFIKRFVNSIQASVGGALLALIVGSMAAYGLSRFQYKWKIWKNRDISFFFLSQLILPPVVLAMPFLVLYKELALLDSMVGLIMIYALMVLPIVIWIMGISSIPFRVNLNRQPWWTVAPPGARSSASFFPLPCPAWSRLSSCQSSCAGTNISSQPFSPAPMPRRCLSWWRARRDHRASAGGPWRPYRQQRSCRSSSSALRSSATS